MPDRKGRLSVHDAVPVVAACLDALFLLPWESRGKQAGGETEGLISLAGVLSTSSQQDAHPFLRKLLHSRLDVCLQEEFYIFCSEVFAADLRELFRDQPQHD